MPNPILSAPAVREARGNIEGRLDAKHTRKWWEDAQRALDAYAAAILAEAKRRVEAMQGQEASAYNPGVMLDAVHGSFVSRAAVLRVLDGRDDA